MKSGDLVFWSGTGITSRIVRWFTKSRWSHVGVVVRWGPRIMIVDSLIGRGVRAVPLSNRLDRAYWVPTNVEWGQSAHAFALDQLERPYSLQNLWKTWRRLNLVASEYHCSQYAATVLSKTGLTIDTNHSPESLYREFIFDNPPVPLF